MVTGNKGAWIMEYPNETRHTSPAQPYIRAAHQARSAAFYEMLALAGRGVGAAVRLLGSPLLWTSRRLDRARRLSAARHELHKMDERMLRDMGISREDIDQLVSHGRAMPDIAAEMAHPHEAKRAAEVVDLRREPDLMGALIVHGPWSRYTDRRRDDAA